MAGDVNVRALAKIERDIQIIKGWFEEHRSVGQLADEYSVSRQYINRLLATTNTNTVQTLARVQLSSIVRDSITALAVLAEEVRTQSERAVDHPIEDEKQDNRFQRKRRNSVEMYKMMFECVTPLMHEFIRREQVLNGKMDTTERNGENSTGSTPDAVSGLPEEAT